MAQPMDRGAMRIMGQPGAAMDCRVAGHDAHDSEGDQQGRPGWKVEPGESFGVEAGPADPRVVVPRGAAQERQGEHETGKDEEDRDGDGAIPEEVDRGQHRHQTGPSGWGALGRDGGVGGGDVGDDDAQSGNASHCIEGNEPRSACIGHRGGHDPQATTS